MVYSMGATARLAEACEFAVWQKRCFSNGFSWFFANCDRFWAARWGPRAETQGFPMVFEGFPVGPWEAAKLL